MRNIKFASLLVRLMFKRQHDEREENMMYVTKGVSMYSRCDCEEGADGVSKECHEPGGTARFPQYMMLSVNDVPFEAEPKRSVRHL